MSGPSTQRENVSTAPIESLQGPVTSFLRGLLANPAQTAQGLLPQSDLQRGASQGLLNAIAGQGATSGQAVIDAASPVFQRNLQLGADILRQTGPRFASGTEQLVGQQQQQAVQDFNLFQQQVLEAGANRQLQALLGAGQLGTQQQGQLANLLLPLLQQGLIAGGAASAPVITQNPGFLQGTLLPLIGTAGTIAATAAGGPAAGAAAGSALGGLGGSTRPPTILQPNPGGIGA